MNIDYDIIRRDTYIFFLNITGTPKFKHCHISWLFHVYIILNTSMMVCNSLFQTFVSTFRQYQYSFIDRHQYKKKTSTNNIGTVIKDLKRKRFVDFVRGTRFKWSCTSNIFIYPSLLVDLKSDEKFSNLIATSKFYGRFLRYKLTFTNFN